MMGNDTTYHSANMRNPSEQLVGDNGFSINSPLNHNARGNKRNSTPKMQQRHTAPVRRKSKSRRTHSALGVAVKSPKPSLPSLEIKQSHSLHTDYDDCNAVDDAKTPNEAPTYKKASILSNPELAAMQLVPPQNQCISIGSIFKYKKVLGKGVSCRALLVEHNQTKKRYAFKEMTRANRKNSLLFVSEVDILRKLKHPHIVEFDDIYMDIHNYYIALEYCTGGTMLERIIDEGYFTERIGANYIRDILKTVSFMHSQNIAHLDLKLNNIVFKDADNDSEGVSTLKVIDFGLSEHIKSDKQRFLEIHGSLHYFPPEIFKDEGRSGKQLKQGDMWRYSLSLLLFVMACDVLKCGSMQITP